ncbi:MAG: ankyrin repeat domain-containing protein [Acidobacteria bacterium]|nr:ankyrin repeat domain-containing protein [Acidobacteriota bacterium]
MRRGRFGRSLCAALLATCVAAGLHASDDVTVAEAARSGDVEAVRALLKKGEDVNEAQGDGMTALHWAAQAGRADLVQMLLAAGANAKATTRLGGYMPLHLASQGGHAATVAALIAAGAAVDERTATGASPLMFAARAGSTDTVTRLLENGADINAAERANGQTALMIAAGLNRADVVTLLLAKGADAVVASKVVDLNKLTQAVEADPLQGQIRQNVPSEAERNQVAGLTRPYRYNELIGAQGGLTALHFAARQGAARAVTALVAGGVAVDAPSPGDKATPLLVAIINGHFDIAAYLLQHGADASMVSDAGVSPLYATLNVQWAPIAAYPQPRAHLQQKVGYLEMMQLLIAKGADPNARVKKKVWYSSYNFDQSSVDEIGATPFWRAAYAADIDAMKLLLAAGADGSVSTMKPMSRRFGGEGGGADRSGLPPVPVGGPNVTPLQAAAGVGYGFGFAANSHHYAPTGMLPAVRFLVEEIGADVNARDADGNTAVHHAAARGDTEMIQYLVSKGADVTRVNRSGQTTVDMANGPVQRTQPYPETIALLEKLGAVNNHKCVSC